jgi:hypothetical protein
MPPEVWPVGFGTVPGVWAHPDDETYLSAGSMARKAMPEECFRQRAEKHGP